MSSFFIGAAKGRLVRDLQKLATHTRGQGWPEIRNIVVRRLYADTMVRWCILDEPSIRLAIHKINMQEGFYRQGEEK